MIKPLRDKIFVKPIKRIQSTLYIQSAEADTVGYITAVGDEAADEGLKVGDKVLYGKWGGTEVKVNGQEFIIMKETDIMGIIN